jgi:hypothetical protein
MQGTAQQGGQRRSLRHAGNRQTPFGHADRLCDPVRGVHLDRRHLPDGPRNIFNIAVQTVSVGIMATAAWSL